VRACSETFRKYVIGLSHGTDAPVIAIDNVNECRVLPTVLLPELVSLGTLCAFT